MGARAAVWVAFGIALLGGWHAQAGTTVPIEAGIHPGFSRLVFDFPRWAGWRMTRRGDVIDLRFSVALPFGPTPELPPGIVALADGPGWARVTVTHGARVRRMHVGLRLVLDVTALPPLPVPPSPLVSRRRRPLSRSGGSVAPVAAAGRDASGRAVGTIGPSAGGVAKPVAAAPETVAEPATPATPVSASVAGAGAVGGGAPSPPAHPRSPVSAPTALLPSPPRPNQALPVYGTPGKPGPIALSARPAVPPAGSPGAMLVPFEAGVGAAAFRRRGQGVAVFDAARPIDLSALAGAEVFGAAKVHVLAGGTELTMPLRRGMRLALLRRSAGWLIVLTRHSPVGPVIRPLPIAAGLSLPLAEPGKTVSLLDPETGTPLLVGTERAAPVAVRVTHRAPQFALLRSWRGVVVEALSDRLRLRPTADGFLLAGRGGLAVSPGGRETAALADAALLTRSFYFPDLATPALSSRLRRQLRAAAARPPLARGPRLRRAAETMIALDMGAEAHALLHLAASEDPGEAAWPEHAALAAIAAIEAGSPAKAGAIDARSLPATDEVTFWRAIRRALQDPRSPRAAQLLASTAPLVLTYPRALRRSLLPLTIETMIRGGETQAAARMLARRPHDKRLDLARAMLDAAQGRTGEALALYDRLSDSSDRLTAFRAATRAVALRLDTHAIGPAQAARDLDKLRDGWRGGERELHLLETLAALRARAGQWTRALALLRHTIRDFPKARPRLRAEMRRLFAAALADAKLDRAPPLHYVAFVNANADLLPKGKAGLPLAGKLADRLLSLDLPDQAAPLLARLAREAPTAPARARFGAKLAELRLDQGNLAAAAKALAVTAASDVPPSLAMRRAILAARIDAAEGHVPEAEAALRKLNAASADRAAATIATRAGDWKGAVAALAAEAAVTVPPSGTLPPGSRQLLLRLATARVRAGDLAGLAAMRADQARMGTGPLADLFRLLTAPGVRSPDQIARAGATAALAAGVGQALRAVR